MCSTEYSFLIGRQGAELEMSQIKNEPKIEDFTAEILRRIFPIFLKHFFRFLAAVHSTPPKIGKNAKFYGRNSAELEMSRIRNEPN